MIELKIKTPQGEKTFTADDITFGAMEECIKLEGASNEEALKMFPEVVKMIFPEITAEDVKYLGLKQVIKLVSIEIPKLMQPVNDAVKN